MTAALAALAALLVGLAGAPAGAGPDDATGTGAAIERRTVRGPVTATVRLQPPQLRFGDAFELRLEVRAEPGIELLMPRFGSALERFRIAEFVPRERIDADGHTLATQSYRLLAPASGSYRIPPLTVEFIDRRPGRAPAPEGHDAYELLTESLPVTVQSVLPAELAQESLRPPLAPLRDPAPGPHWPWIAGLLTLLLAAAGVAGWLLRKRRGERRRSAYDKARARLDRLLGGELPEPGQAEPFFVELSDLVRHYVEDRFGLQAPERTTEEFLDLAAGAPELNADQRAFLQHFLSQSDRVKFARERPAAREDLQRLLAAVGDFLEQTRERDDGTPRSVHA